MTDPDTIPRALEFVASAEAGVLVPYRDAVRHLPDTRAEFKAAILPAIAARLADLAREQQRRRR